MHIFFRGMAVACCMQLLARETLIAPVSDLPQGHGSIHPAYSGLPVQHLSVQHFSVPQHWGREALCTQCEDSKEGKQDARNYCTALLWITYFQVCNMHLRQPSIRLCFGTLAPRSISDVAAFCKKISTGTAISALT